MCMFDKLGLLSIIVASLIVILGIVHLGVGIGIVSEYRDYDDIFRQSVGLAGFNIVIGIFATAVGVLGAFVIIRERQSLKKNLLLTSAIVAIFTLASLISAMAINSQSISYIRTHLSNRMNSYVQDEESIYVTDRIQRDFQCCGVHLWLDWARISLGSPLRTANSNTTATTLAKFPTPSSLLKRSLQLKNQQMAKAQNFYNFPSGYSVTLPLSCCKNGALTSGNAISGYCIYSANNGTTNFYITGCLAEVANTAVSQISGFILINTILTILSFVFVPIVMSLFAASTDSNNTKYPNSLPAAPSPPVITNIGQSNASPSYYQPSYSPSINPSVYHSYNTPMYRYY